MSKTSKCDLLHFFFWINFFNIFNHRKKNLFDKKITFNVMHQRLYFLSKMHQLKHMVVVLFLYDINFVQKILFHWWCPICVSLKIFYWMKQSIKSLQRYQLYVIFHWCINRLCAMLNTPGNKYTTSSVAYTLIRPESGQMGTSFKTFARL